jgi:hypothetical protein
MMYVPRFDKIDKLIDLLERPRVELQAKLAPKASNKGDA